MGTDLFDQLDGDARRMLTRARFSRRAFLKSVGALVVVFEGGARGTLGPVSARQGINGAGSDRLDAWLAVDASGEVTAYTGKCELGQGLFTAQTQLVAEELGVRFDAVHLVQCDTALTPDQGTTSGAQSHPANFNQDNLARAAATAREALIGRAAERLGLPPGELRVGAGIVRSERDPSRQVSYGELVGPATFGIQLDAGTRRRSPEEWTILGQSVPRVELPSMTRGQFEYVHNVRVPGMLHGQVVRPPRVGARLAGVDAASVEGMAGLVDIVVRNDFVGVVAEKPWQAIQIAGRLACDWSGGGGLPDADGFYDRLRTGTPTRDTLMVDSGDVETRIAGAADSVEATYFYPYQMHASIGTSAAVADVRGEEATIWSATQAVYPLRQSAAMVLGIPADNIRVIFRMGAGCYGVNGADTVSYDAALLSQAVGRPVRVQLTRRDEMAWENYGNAFVISQRAGLDAGGDIIAWDHESWSPARGSRPGASNPGNVVTGFLAGFEPQRFVPRSPAPAPVNFNNRSNGVPSYVTGCVGDRCGGTGTIASQRVLTHTVESPFWTGPLRSPARLQNTFAHESFMDEMAARVGADPVEFRLRHLADSRLREVLGRAASTAGWESRPSPRSGAPRTGVVSGRGIACVLYEGDNGYCAMVAEVEVDQDSGRVGVRRLVIAGDCGPVSNPDGLRNQLEGGALHGVSRTLLEEVTWDSEKITSIDWLTYPPLYLDGDTPAIETVLVDRTSGRAMGAGETAVTVAAAAIANAVFDAAGVRLRQVPFTPERVRAALARRGP